MSVADRKLFSRQAEQLYRRGMAAARGGNKALAASLLRQAVKLNPQHEQAWLWLSGVLETPEDAAFCLRAVLGINPGNQRAQRGLQWLEFQHGAINPGSRTISSILGLHAPPDQWWSAWRARQSTWLWTLRALLLIPIVLLGSTLGLRAIVTAAPLPEFYTYRDVPVPTTAPTALASAPAIAPTVRPSSDRATPDAYFVAINREREVLQTATATYRSATDSGRTTVERTTATRQLRDQIQHSREAFIAIQPPPELSAAHTRYVEGLAQEQEAFDQMLEFYRSYDAAVMNRAALRLQDARSNIALATASWDAFAQQHGFVTTPKAQ